MTRLVAKTALDMTNWSNQFADSIGTSIGAHDATHFVTQSGDHTYSVGGEHFSYSDLLLTLLLGGTVHSLTVAGEYGPEFTMSGITMGATSLFTDIFVLGAWNSLESSQLGGKDSIVGSKAGDHLLGFGGNDTIKGNGGKDILSGGGGADKLVGGGDHDRFDYGAVSDSTGKTFDRITDFHTNANLFGFDFAVQGIDSQIVGGTLSKAHFDNNLKSAVNAQHLDPHHAVLFKPDHGTYHGHTFLIVDANGQPGYQAGADYVIDVTRIHGALHLSNFDLIT